MLLPLYHHYPPPPPPLPPPHKTLLSTHRTLFPISKTLTLKNSTTTNKPSKTITRSSKPDSHTLPRSAIQRIADKLRSLGFTESNPKPEPEPGTAGEIFIPLPTALPKHRVGHTLDPSWSTPENPVPEPGSGNAITTFHELRKEVWKEKELERKFRKKGEKVPTLAELSLNREELRRLTRIGIEERKKLKVGKAGITEGIVNGVHERWRRHEVVKIACEDLCRLNMKRTHELLEV